MKAILLILAVFAGSHATYSQDVMRMEDNVSATFKLTKMTLIQLDKIRQVDLEGKDTKYYAKVKFGKRTFDLEHMKSNHGKNYWWGSYALFRPGEYFKKDAAQSNGAMEVYSIKKNTSQGTEEYEVTFLKGMNLEVIVSYSTTKTGEKNLDKCVMGSGEL